MKKIYLIFKFLHKIGIKAKKKYNVRFPSGKRIAFLDGTGYNIYIITQAGGHGF